MTAPDAPNERFDHDTRGRHSGETEVRQIPLSKFRAFALVDDEDFDWLDAVGPWQFACGRYGRRFEYCNGKRTVIWIGTELQVRKPPPDMVNRRPYRWERARKQSKKDQPSHRHSESKRLEHRTEGGRRTSSLVDRPLSFPNDWHVRQEVGCSEGKILRHGSEEGREAHAFCAYHLRGWKIWNLREDARLRRVQTGSINAS